SRALACRGTGGLLSVGEIRRRVGRPVHSTDPSDEATRPDLLSALRSIPPKLAAAIVLRHYHGYNNREIAAAFGVSERTVGTRLRQAGERLRAVLEPSFPLGAPPAFPSDTRESYAED